MSRDANNLETIKEQFKEWLLDGILKIKNLITFAWKSCRTLSKRLSDSEFEHWDICDNALDCQTEVKHLNNDVQKKPHELLKLF